MKVLYQHHFQALYGGKALLESRDKGIGGERKLKRSKKKLRQGLSQSPTSGETSLSKHISLPQSRSLEREYVWIPPREARGGRT